MELSSTTGTWFAGSVLSWTIKYLMHFRSELVFPEKEISATVSFKSHTVFWSVVNNKESFEYATNRGAVVLTGSLTSVDIFKQKLLGSEAATNNKENIASPMPMTRSRGLSGEIPLKSGWLLKKRDLFSGWRCRYFVVYPGRVDYFIDQHDMQTRGTVPLYGAEVSPVRKMTINGVSDHWGMT
jgi:hypothetical protein